MADSQNLVSRRCRCCHGTGKEWFDGKTHVETNVCPKCKGKGKTLVDDDLCSDWIVCSRCMGEKVIHANGKCLYHPPFTFIGVYNYSAAGEKYDNGPTCIYCGEPAPGYDEAIEKKKRSEETRKKGKDAEKEENNEIDDLKKRIERLKGKVSKLEGCVQDHVRIV